MRFLGVLRDGVGLYRNRDIGKPVKKGDTRSYGAGPSYTDKQSTHDTYPIFNAVSPTALSLNESFARGDTIRQATVESCALDGEG